MKLNLGCGLNPREGFINVDHAPMPGVDVVADLEQPLPWDDDSVDESIGVHVLEHLQDPVSFMAELWRVHKKDTTATFALPYGSSDDAWEDPTHVRPYFLNSFAYFGQPAYWRSDYGYRADWDIAQIQLDLPRDRYAGAPEGQILAEVLSLRNVVKQMVVTLRACKPIRPAVRAEVPPQIVFNLVTGEQ